jgi:predicted GNAT superfamily acetyltransferase
VARNAHINLNRLGAEIIEYVPEMYGVDTGSKLHQALGMDRFIVAWHITNERVIQKISGQVPLDIQRYAMTPVVNSKTLENGTTVVPFDGELLMLPKIRVEIPQDIQTVKAESSKSAIHWRATTRRTFMWYLEKGYKVNAFYRDRETCRCFYIVSM